MTTITEKNSKDDILTAAAELSDHMDSQLYRAQNTKNAWIIFTAIMAVAYLLK